MTGCGALGSSMEMTLADEAATLALAARFAQAVPAMNTNRSALKLYLQGDLGAGKTCFARGFLESLGVQRTVRSPTYALMETYLSSEFDPARTPRPSTSSRTKLEAVLHLDLYRLADPHECEGLGLADFDQPGWVWLMEWPERGGQDLPPADVRCTFHVQRSDRRVVCEAFSEPGQRWMRDTVGHNSPEL